MSKACVFRLGDRRLAVRAHRVREVVNLEHVTPVPLTPRYVSGISNLRGTILPVIDLRPVLGLDDGAETDGHSAVAGTTLACTTAGLDVGLAADEIVGIGELSDRALRPLDDGAPEALRRFALGEVEAMGGTTVLLDVDRLIHELKIDRPERLSAPTPILAPATSPARRESWQ